MVWILLLVHITLHGMIGGLLKHFPKAVCGIIFFICKNIFECQKKKSCFFFYLRLNASVTVTHTTTTSPISVERAGFFFLSCDASAGFLFLSLALIRKFSQHGITISQYSRNTHRDAIFPLLSNLGPLLET